jgi:hypothetical protein
MAPKPVGGKKPRKIGKKMGLTLYPIKSLKNIRSLPKQIHRMKRETTNQLLNHFNILVAIPEGVRNIKAYYEANIELLKGAVNRQNFNRRFNLFLKGDIDQASTSSRGIGNQSFTKEDEVAFINLIKIYISAGLPITGAKIQEEAMLYWNSVHDHLLRGNSPSTRPKFSDSWLTKFTEKHQLTQHKVAIVKNTLEGLESATEHQQEIFIGLVRRAIKQFGSDSVANIDEKPFKYVQSPPDCYSIAGTTDRASVVGGNEKAQITLNCCCTASGLSNYSSCKIFFSSWSYKNELNIN